MQAVDQRSTRWAPGLSPAPGHAFETLDVEALAVEPLPQLLQRWGAPPPRPPAPLAERLGAWLGWAEAIQLSQALAAAPEPVTPPPDPAAALAWAEAALARLTDELHARCLDPELAHESAQALTGAPLPLNDALAPYRLHHTQVQRLMAARCGALRERLRARLAEASPEGARLAALDAVLAPALLAPERAALAAGPGWLAQRAATHLAACPSGWPARLWADQQALLQAELDLRLQPLLGLIAALRSHTLT